MAAADFRVVSMDAIAKLGHAEFQGGLTTLKRLKYIPVTRNPDAKTASRKT
jgi:hypothetical protein